MQRVAFEIRDILIQVISSYMGWSVMALHHKKSQTINNNKNTK